MKKEEIRKEFFKLKVKGHTNNQCRIILRAKYDYEVNIRTLRRWTNKLNQDHWDLRDKSKRPKTIHRKITPEIEKKIISIKNKTGWGDEKIEDKYVISVIDDCSRKSLAFVAISRVTTDTVINIIDNLIKTYGKPKQILTDNGSAYGSKSKHSRFDRKLNLRGIEHIRGAVHSPTTQGKVERLFQTFKREFKFCNNDSELWRMRYNHFRPHTSLNKRTPDEIYNDFNLLF